jgi:hypothetical protein
VGAGPGWDRAGRIDRPGRAAGRLADAGKCQRRPDGGCPVCHRDGPGTCPIGHAAALAHAVVHSCAQSNAPAFADIHLYSDAHPYPYADGNDDAYADDASYPDVDADPYTDAHADPYAVSCADSQTLADADADPSLAARR